MKIERVWAMPNKWTFQIKPIAELLKRYNVGKGWVDVFPGETHICEYESDGKDGLYYVSGFDDNFFDGALLDPPYSYRQLFKTYRTGSKALVGRLVPMTEVNNRIAYKLKEGGYCISFGWNSNGLGIKRGYKIVEIFLVAHGGHHNDTIVTVEKNIMPYIDESEMLSKEGNPMDGEC